MTRQSNWRFAFVGGWRDLEFREVVEWLSAHTQLHFFPDATAAANAIAAEHFDGVVLGQSRRGEFSGEAIEALHRAAPLVRLRIVYGAWCEGETRSGNPPAGVVRWHWLQAAPRLAAELAQLSRRESWSQPRAATELDRLQAASAASECERRSGLLAISARDKIAYETIAEPCLAAGYECLWLKKTSDLAPRGAVALIADFEPAEPNAASSHRDAERIAKLVERASGARLILLVGYPRFDDVELARQRGAEVCAKPFLSEDLLFRLPE
jgi:hypothetical protein